VKREPPEDADGDAEEPSELAAEVDIPQGAFDPANAENAYGPLTFTIPVGTTVWWTNNDSVAHTVTSGVSDGTWAPRTVALRVEVVLRLEVHPEPLGRPEVPPEPQRRVRRDPARPMHDLVDPPRRHADVLRHPVLRDPQRPTELLEQHFAGMHRSSCAVVMSVLVTGGACHPRQ